MSLGADKEPLITAVPPSQPQDSVNGPSQPSEDRSLQTTSPPDVAPGNENRLAVPVPLRKSRPVSMGARIQVPEDKQVTDQSGDLGPAANLSQKTSQSRPNSCALEALVSEKLANGSLELPAQASPRPSKRDSDCGSLSTSDSVDYGASLSADLSLNRETGSLSIKVMLPLAHRLGASWFSAGLGYWKAVDGCLPFLSGSQGLLFFFF